MTIFVIANAPEYNERVTEIRNAFKKQFNIRVYAKALIRPASREYSSDFKAAAVQSLRKILNSAFTAETIVIDAIAVKNDSAFIHALIGNARIGVQIRENIKCYLFEDGVLTESNALNPKGEK